MKRKMMALLTTAAIGLSIFAAPSIIAEAAEGDVTFNGEVIDVSEATELTNEYGTGYLLSDGSTLVVTADNGNGVSRYPWYGSKDVITKAIIADTVTVMDNTAFKDYTKLTEVDFNDNMTAITDYSFDGCTGLTELDLPSNLVTLEGFYGCTGLTELEIPASVQTVKGFTGCTNLERLILHEGLKTITGFKNCSSLTSLSIPDTVITVGDYDSFYGCSDLVNIDFGNGVESISGFVFCSSLTSVVIPDSVTELGDLLFNHCNNLAEITGGNNISSFTNNEALRELADTLTLTTSNVEFIEFVQNNYTGKNDTNLRIIELDAEIAIGNDTMTVTGSVDTRVVTLDVSIPVGGVQFTIDGDGKLTSQGIVVTSNTTVPLTVNVLSAEGQASGVDSEGVITTLAAPKLVPANTFTVEQWDNLGQYGTKQQIAIALKQVDVLDDGLGNLSAGEELTEATTDEAKVTTPVELGNIPANSKLAHVLSGVQTAQNIGINIEKDNAFTNYGKEWLDAETAIFRYNVTLEFTY